MKKICVAAAIMLILLSFFGCNKAEEQQDSFKIVCSLFPQYDWIKNITKGADNVELVLICDSGSDIHSLQASARDIIEIENSDILIYIADFVDGWMADSANKAFSLTAIVSPESHEHIHSQDCDLSHNAYSDEHLWMSLKKAVTFTEKITDVLCEYNPENATVYRKNSKEYIQKLVRLDNEYSTLCKSADTNVIVVADRFPFFHLTNDYSLTCYAAFPGCSADTDADFDTIINLSEKVVEHDLWAIATTEKNTGKTAKAVLENANKKGLYIVEIDSMQSVSEKDIQNGATYLGIMEENLKALEKLLKKQQIQKTE